MRVVTVPRAAVILCALFVALFQIPAPPGAVAATPLTVAQAIAAQGTTATVRGYVVGQPTATTTVLRSGFTGDTALALADTASTTNTSSMVYVQITSAFRAAWGLRTNPSRMGTRIDVTGPLRSYFSHAGLTSPSAFAAAGSTTPPTTTPSPTTTPPPAGDYYAAAAGKSGAALKTALHQIISTGVTKLTYDQVWTALKVTDQDPANTNDVIEIYSGRSVPKTSNGGDPDDWNREHVWAKSHGDFGTSTGPGTDVHHLRPEDVTVNSTRGNKDFDDGGSAVAQAPGSLTDADSFEPRDAVKGDVARMIFYMAVRYEGGDGYPNLEVDDAVSSGTAPRLGRVSTLLEWNAEDPPDAFERHRNDVIYSQFQHNRNPFVDHPDWVASIF
jgi:endonuclease I